MNETVTKDGEVVNVQDGPMESGAVAKAYMTEDEIERQIKAICEPFRRRPKLIYDYGGEAGPHWSVDAGKMIATMFGIEWNGLSTERFNVTKETEIVDKNGDPIIQIRHSAYFEWTGSDGRKRRIQGTGKATTDEPGIAGRRAELDRRGKERKNVAGFGQSVDSADSMALARMFRNGVEASTGVPGITWDDLRRYAGITRDMVSSADFFGGGDGDGNRSNGGGGRRNNADKDFLWAVLKGEVSGLTKDDLAGATNHVVGHPKMLKDMTDDQIRDVAAALRNGPPPQQTQQQPEPKRQEPAPKQAPADNGNPAQDATIAEINRLHALLDENGMARAKNKALEQAGWSKGAPITDAIARATLDILAAWCDERGVSTEAKDDDVPF